jgi:DNA-binding NarL/FixJ family response regulator
MASVSVLLADDDPVARRCIRRALEGDPRVEIRWEADNGLQALLLCKQYRPDIIVMDSDMPRMDGIEATRCLRQCNRAVRVLLMSIYEQEREQAMTAGADAFVTKDCGCSAIREALSRLMGELARSDRENRDTAA